MTVLQGGGQNLPPPHVCVIQKASCGIGLSSLTMDKVTSSIELKTSQRIENAF